MSFQSASRCESFSLPLRPQPALFCERPWWPSPAWTRLFAVCLWAVFLVRAKGGQPRQAIAKTACEGDQDGYKKAWWQYGLQQCLSIASGVNYRTKIKTQKEEESERERERRHKEHLPPNTYTPTRTHTNTQYTHRHAIKHKEAYATSAQLYWKIFRHSKNHGREKKKKVGQTRQTRVNGIKK